MRIHACHSTVGNKTKGEQCDSVCSAIKWLSVLCLGVIGVVSVFFVGSVSGLTYQTEVDVDFTFNPVVNLAVSGDLIISDLSPGNSSDSNIITITAGSNSAYGYTLYSTVGSSSSNYTDLRLSPSNSTNKFTNLSANKATLSAFSDNTWGYSYCNFTSNANACNTTSNWVSGNVGSTSAGYNGLPLYNSSNQESGIMLINSNTPSETNLKFKIGAKASTAQASGTYSNVINFIGVGKVVTTSYTISYNGNGGTAPANQTGTTDTGAVKLTATAPTKLNYLFKGWCDVNNTSDPTTCSGNIIQPNRILGLNTTASSITKNLYAVWEKSIVISCSGANKICYGKAAPDSEVEGTMGEQSANANTSVTLLASNFSRAGYGFAGWNTKPDYSGINYGPQETITTPSDMSSGLSLYAIWIESAGNLQNWSGCSSLASGAVTALTDQRDGETYAVAKLADGNCWMIENLRLDNTNSDNSTGALSQGYASGFIGLADPESPWSYASTTANSLYGTDGSTDVTISGSNPYYRMPRYNNVNTPSSASDRPSNPTSNSATNSTSNAGMYSYGNYYTWAAASTDTSETSTGDYNTKSICPTGWSIPRGGNKSRESTNDFWKYIVTNLNSGVNPANYNSSSAPYYTGTAEAGPVANALRSYPNNFVYSGYLDSSSVGVRGSQGFYWSSTAYSSISAYNLYLVSSNVYPGTISSVKSSGRSVRCFTPGS